MNLKSRYFDWIKSAKCPCCGVGTFEFVTGEDSGILVNCESKGRYSIDKFWIPSRVCCNPLCEWSRIKHDIKPYNMCNVDEAWEMIDKKEDEKDGD